MLDLRFWGKVRPSLLVLHPLTTWVDIPRNRSYPFLRMKPSHTYGALGFGHPPNFVVRNGENQAQRTAACLSLTRVCELHRRESLRGRGRGVHSRRAVPAAAFRVCGTMPGPGGARGLERTRGLRALPLPPRPAPLLRPRTSGAHACAALLPVRESGVRRTPAPNLRSGLRVRGPRAGAALVPAGQGPLRA